LQLLCVDFPGDKAGACTVDRSKELQLLAKAAGVTKPQAPDRSKG
jgi:hypothetical protein